MKDWERRKLEAHKEFCRSRLVDDSEAEHEEDALSLRERNAVECLRAIATGSDQNLDVALRLLDRAYPKPVERDPVAELLEQARKGTGWVSVEQLERALKERDNA